MTTFVLIHGGWHGGWCWKNCLPHLRNVGHEVYAPTLTGLGERSHLLSRDIDLGCHVQDVVNVLSYENLEDVILVGHSYAGMVITAVADRCPERIAQLVYLDAFVPENGQSAFDIMTASSAVDNSASDPFPPDMWLFPPPTAEEMGVLDPVEAKWLEKNLTPHPLATTVEKVHLNNSSDRHIKKSFISCTVDQERLMPSMAMTAHKIRQETDWTYIELETGHDAMVTAPEELSRILINLI